MNGGRQVDKFSVRAKNARRKTLPENTTKKNETSRSSAKPCEICGEPANFASGRFCSRSCSNKIGARAAAKKHSANAYPGCTTTSNGGKANKTASTEPSQKDSPNACEICGEPALFGSGRFCSRSCACTVGARVSASRTKTASKRVQQEAESEAVQQSQLEEQNVEVLEAEEEGEWRSQEELMEELKAHLEREPDPAEVTQSVRDGLLEENGLPESCPAGPASAHEQSSVDAQPGEDRPDGNIHHNENSGEDCDESADTKVDEDEDNGGSEGGEPVDIVNVTANDDEADPELDLMFDDESDVEPLVEQM